MKKIIDFLEQLGLSEIEANLYKGLLETGATTVKDLSEHVGIKRITAHFNIEHLIERGLVTQVKKGQKRNIVAEPPERLGDLIKQKEQEIEIIKNNLQDTVNTLYSIIPSAKEESGVEVKYYEGKKAVASIYHETLLADEVYSFVNLDKYYEIFPNTDTIFWDALNTNAKRQVWDISVDSDLARKLGNEHPRYFCKFIAKSNFFTGFDIQVYNNKLAIIQLEQQNTVATVIKSKALYESLKGLHHSMWMLLPDKKN